MENPRTTSARDHDDHELIDAAVADADPNAVAGDAGGHIQTDVGTKADLDNAVKDPAGRVRPEKQDEIDHGDAYPAARGPNRQ